MVLLCIILSTLHICTQVIKFWKRKNSYYFDIFCVFTLQITPKVLYKNSENFNKKSENGTAPGIYFLKLHLPVVGAMQGNCEKVYSDPPLIARFMGPTYGPSGADRTQVGPMLTPWTLLSGRSYRLWCRSWDKLEAISPMRFHPWFKLNGTTCFAVTLLSSTKSLYINRCRSSAAVPLSTSKPGVSVIIWIRNWMRMNQFSMKFEARWADVPWSSPQSIPLH